MTMTTIAAALPRRKSRPIGAKRLLDVALTTILLLMIWPLFLAIALAVAISSPGPVFFVQTRVGLNGQSFRMMKFRSMYRDAEARRAALRDAAGNITNFVGVQCKVSDQYAASVTKQQQEEEEDGE